MTLKAGEQVEIPVDLKKWFAFDKAGMFAVRGSYAMEFHDPEVDHSPHIWTDYACAEFMVTIKEDEKAGREEEVAGTAKEANPNPAGNVPPAKATMALLWIADAEESERFVFLLNGSVAYRTVAGLKRHVAGLPEGSTLTWNPGCCRMGGEPLLSSGEELKAFQAFCEDEGVDFVLVPSG